MKVTIVSNRDQSDMVRSPFKTTVRLIGRSTPEWRKANVNVQVDPVRDFDVKEFAAQLIMIDPAQVVVGAAPKYEGHPEPKAAKLRCLLSALQAAGIKVRTRATLERLLK